MKIDRKLNLVIPVERDDGIYYVHSSPLGNEAFDLYYLVLAKTFAALYSEGLNWVAGPKVAAKMLRDVAKAAGRWEGPTGVEHGLLAEIRRLSNVVLPGATGWTSMPLQSALDRAFFDADEVSEVESVIVYFIVASSMHNRKDLAEVLEVMTKIWGVQTTSLTSTTYATSLMTSKEAVNTGEKVPQSSIPR